MGDFKDKRVPPAVSGTPRPGAQPASRSDRPALPVDGKRDRSAVVSPAPAQPPKAGSRGRIVHDERGNAIWDWLKETGRIAMESTSRLLRRLEVTELKVEETKDEELRLESDSDRGGYDPYNQPAGGKKRG